ncbi:tripartite tricarboxylate transporter permease [Peribacillus saganii]|uniref:tripartite tricarboxylate transporter permease n=1 Tax=Peribacillus saganii TaxID=2303992 RepID=UPI001314ED71|nr:tripartite tricarboxylate transporter permease [Peribacillus saganii]
METILEALSILFTFESISFLVIGLTVGFIAGALPGFSSSNACAILLPLTIGFDLTTALIFMASIYAGAQFAGAIPAIMINTPGTMGAAATALDGYPMAQKGKAELAIGIARMASAVGGVIGAAIVLIVINPMSSFALKFGSVEMFLVALFGLTLITTIVGENVRDGLISACLGLLVAAMSADPLLGQGRFTMGFIELYDNVPFVPILIGLFGITEMYFLSKKKRLIDTDIKKIEGSSLKEVINGVVETLKYPKDIFRASILGTFIGAIPGTGTAVSNFISYGIAKKTSKNKEQFGKGAPEGIIASEACDSAVASGTLIPTLTLGIPGSSTAAIMLAAFYLHGINPGPRVMIDQAAESYAVILALGLASLLILPLGVLLATPMIQITRVKPAILVPTILLLCTIGSFALSNSMFDVFLMLVFGIMGVIMRINGYPIVPFVLAVILGPIAEANFVRAFMLSKGDFSYFFATPIALVLWAIIFVSLFAGPIKKAVSKLIKRGK